jgi:hypothetical protein
VWRGGPDEGVNVGERDAGGGDDWRRIRDDGGTATRDDGGAVPAYGVPAPEYAVPLPDPVPVPMYGVEPDPHVDPRLG